MSDSFSLAQGILAAIDAGARIINISMGSYAETAVLTSAVDYASSHGAVIVASAGNDGAARLTWPAADARSLASAENWTSPDVVRVSTCPCRTLMPVAVHCWLAGTATVRPGPGASGTLSPGLTVPTLSLPTSSCLKKKAFRRLSNCARPLRTSASLPCPAADAIPIPIISSWPVNSAPAALFPSLSCAALYR